MYQQKEGASWQRSKKKAAKSVGSIRIDFLNTVILWKGMYNEKNIFLKAYNTVLNR